MKIHTVADWIKTKTRPIFLLRRRNVHYHQNNHNYNMKELGNIFAGNKAGNQADIISLISLKYIFQTGYSENRKKIIPH